MHIQAVIASKAMTNIGLHLVAFQVCRIGRRLEFASHSTCSRHETCQHTTECNTLADAAGTMSASSAPFAAQSLIHAVTVDMKLPAVHAATQSDTQTELCRY